jgi:hypothetical protein
MKETFLKQSNKDFRDIDIDSQNSMIGYIMEKNDCNEWQALEELHKHKYIIIIEKQ